MGTCVLAAGVGLTHYYNQLLNRLQRDLGIAVVLVAADDERGNAGAGVFQTEEGVEFRIHRLREWTVPNYYRSFRGLPRLIRELRPGVVLTGVEHLAAFTFDPRLRAA